LEGIDPALFCVASVAPLAKEPAKSISAVGSLVSTPLVSGVQAGGRDPENHRHQRPFMALLDTVQARGLTPNAASLAYIGVVYCCGWCDA